MRSPYPSIHASCVVLGRAGEALGPPPDAGILILGPSGAGKSDLALRLLERGAMLVSDDRTELFVADGALRARAPRRLRGMIEVRGVGILQTPFCEQARIALAVALESRPMARLPEPEYYDPPPTLALRPESPPALFRLDVRERSAPSKVIAAVLKLAPSRSTTALKCDRSSGRTPI